jgi:Pilus assembly protein, PilO
VLGLWWQLAYKPCTRAIIEYHELCNAFHKKSQTLATTKQTTTQLQDQLALLAQQIQTFNAPLDDLQGAIEQLLVLAQQSNLALVSYSTNQQQKTKDWYTQQKVNFNFTGSHESLHSFLLALKNTKKMITVSNLVLNSGTKNNYTIQLDIGLLGLKKTPSTLES